MRELMEKAHFPEDIIEEVLERENELKQNGGWSRISDMAEVIMQELSGGKALQEKLQEVESWEKELGFHKYTLDLLVLLCCWEILESRYKEQKMPMDIFYDSLDDMRCKLLECRDVYGVSGIFVGFWYDRFFDMSRFALGRLQFELETYPFEEAYTKNGVTVKKGDTVINMHIPSSGPLYKEEVDEAFNRAAEFYKEKFPDGTIVFVADSWLLDPDLVKLLPKGNVQDFAQRFALIHTKKCEKFMDGWRVFGSEWEKEPQNLPRRTKLQRAAADYLQQGGRLGEGYGVLIYQVDLAKKHTV